MDDSANQPRSIGEWYQRLTYTPDTGKLTEADIDKDREAYMDLLDKCEAAIAENPSLANPANRGGFNFFPAEPPHFLLSYQHRHNVKIFKRLSQVYRKMFPEVCFVAPHVKAALTGQTPPPRHHIRVGFVSGRMSKLSSVMKDRMGVIKLLDRSKFSVALFSFAEPKDNFGNMAKAMVDEYYLCDPQNFIQTRDRIAALQFDILVYCELGFGPNTYALAHCWLAPVQVTTWGHSDTSGLPTIHHYISTKLYEVEDREEAQSHYSEKLILHESLCTHYFRPYDEGVAKSMRGRERFFLPASATLYLLIQTPFKIVNRFLLAIASILRKDPSAILIMTSHPTDHIPGERNYKTLESVLEPHEISRVRMYPWMPYIEAQNLIKVSDVLLDSYPFGGCNTSIESLSVGKPVITMPARFLYGRFTYGFYRKMGIMDLVASSFEEYERLALKVGMDADYRREISMKILAASPCLFEDMDSVKEWNETMEALVTPHVTLCSMEDMWSRCISDFHRVLAPWSPILWKGTLLTHSRQETPSPKEPYHVALLASEAPPLDRIGAEMTKAGFLPNQKMDLAKDPWAPKAVTIVFQREKCKFVIDIVDDVSAGSSQVAKTNGRRRGPKGPSAFRSLTIVNQSLLFDQWTPATKWKKVAWENIPLPSDHQPRTPLRSIVNQWLKERFGQGWDHEVQVSPSPAHAFFNLRAPLGYTFIPAMKGVGVKEIKKFIQRIAKEANVLRVYCHSTYDMAALKVALTGMPIQWLKGVHPQMPLNHFKEMVAKDRQDHPSIRPFAMAPHFVTNLSVIFPPSDFDAFVVTLEED